MPAHTKDFPVVDVDSHVLEPTAVWTDYLEPEYRTLARSSFWYEADESGLTAVVLNGSAAPPMTRGALNRLALYRPGMTPKDVGALDPTRPQPLTPGARDPKQRLQDMDAMGIDQALVMPTLFAEYFPAIENPDVAAALARAYNNWALDFCKGAPDRLFPAALLPMQSPAFAVKEAGRVAAAGFKAVFIRPSFYQKRFPSHSTYDALWPVLQEAGLAVCFHPSPGSANTEWTSEGQFLDRVAAQLRIGHPLAETVAPSMDNGLLLSAICFMGHMELYPRLKMAYLHSGAYWVPLALEKSETYLWLAPQMVRPVSLEPADVFLHRPSLVSFDAWESCVGRIRDFYSSIAAWGSRYPHHDATDAWEAIDNLKSHGVPRDEIAALMGGNAARLYRLPTAAPSRS